MGIERKGFLKIGDQLVTPPDHYPVEFGERYTVYTKERRILQRAIFVVDRENVIRYAEYMYDLGDKLE
jgi:thiol peroxidase